MFNILLTALTPSSNNISVILWHSILVVEETTDSLQVTDKLYHMLYSKDSLDSTLGLLLPHDIDLKTMPNGSFE
jgi:hypothetical protein